MIMTTTLKIVTALRVKQGKELAIRLQNIDGRVVQAIMIVPNVTKRNLATKPMPHSNT